MDGQDAAAPKPLVASVNQTGNLDTSADNREHPEHQKEKKTFTIQAFPNPPGENEGKTILGETKVTTNRQGEASFTLETTRRVRAGENVTATATGPGNNTSEFSDPLQAGSP